MNINQRINDLKEKSQSSVAKQRIIQLVDEGSFVEMGAFVKNRDELAEAVCGFATVNGEGVYVFAQNPDSFGGAMSLAQAQKIFSLYELAGKNGVPIIGIFDSKGGFVEDGADAMSAFSKLINSASLLSGVVPQIAVVAGTCTGENAILCAQFDIVIMEKSASLSLYPSSVYKNADEVGTAQSAYENGTAHIVCDRMEACFDNVKSLLSLLPQNNLAPAMWLQSGTPSVCPVIKAELLDCEDKIHLSDGFGKTAETLLARIDGKPCGAVLTKESRLDADSVAKISRFVRMCDGFSIPVITIINADGFAIDKQSEIANGARLAAQLSSVYCEATTGKISVIAGRACGGVYSAFASKGTAADLVFAFPDGVVSPLSPEAAAIIVYSDRLNKGESIESLAQDYTENFGSAIFAAEKGYIDEIVTKDQIRAKLSSALDCLESKRESRPAKKHTNFPF